MPLPSKCSPLSTSETVQLSKDVTPWIGINMKDGNNYTNPAAGLSNSRVHTYVRQVRVVVVKLREKLDKINEEIKLLLKMKNDLARSLDELNFEIRSQSADANLKRPRFIKNRSRDADLELYQRGPDSVRLQKSEMRAALHRLQGQYTTVREQLQELGKTRNELTSAILERTRVLDMFPYVISASRKKYSKIEEEKRKEKTRRSSGVRRTQSEKQLKYGPSTNVRGVPVQSKTTCRNQTCVGCVSCFPSAITRHCKSALDVARQKNIISKEVRGHVKGVVEECFLIGQQFPPAEQVWTSYPQNARNRSTCNPYQAMYRSKNFKTISNRGAVRVK